MNTLRRSTIIARANSRPEALTRRTFLKTGAAGAVGIGAFHDLATRALAAAPARSIPGPHALNHPHPAFDPALLRLVNRATFGFNRDTYAQAETLGYNDWLESQLDHEAIDDSDLDNRLAYYDTIWMSSQEIWDTYESNPMAMQDVAVELLEATLIRAVYSKRQLFERMVEFWTDHFNIDILDGPCVFLKTADDREVIRRHAMTTFPQLLHASARSAAMLYYLDNYANVAGHAQENYARELMELHTLGVDGGYTQHDVEDVARCFTGWQFILEHEQHHLGDFFFIPNLHDFGPKTVLGHDIAPWGGETDGQTVLDILAYHPSTAAHISKKLCARFLGYDPSPDIVAAVTHAYLATGGDIKTMLRIILSAPVLMGTGTPKVKRSFHYMSSILRAADAEIDDARLLVFLLFYMGQVPFFWHPPNGYPDTLAAWSGLLLPRWRASQMLMNNEIEGVTIDLNALLTSESASDPAVYAAAINRILSGSTLSPQETTMLQSFYEQTSAYDVRALAETFSLAASMPAMQWY